MSMHVGWYMNMLIDNAFEAILKLLTIVGSFVNMDAELATDKKEGTEDMYSQSLRNSSQNA